MSLQSFFDRFALLTAAPNGIAKLRNLIFELSSQGKLNHGGYDGFPSIWIEARVGEVTEIIMGQAPAGSECNKRSEGTVFVKAGEFGTRYPIIREWTTQPLRLARPGDVLICVVGATAGKLNLGINCAIGRSVAALRPNENITTEYLFNWLKPRILSIRKESRGSAQGVITRDFLEQMEILIPPVEEQKRIVEKVDELLGLCDELEARQQAKRASRARLNTAILAPLNRAASLAPEEFEQATTRLADNFDRLYDSIDIVSKLRSTIVQLAVQGKLVPQDIRDQPVLDEQNMRLQAQEILFRSPDSWGWKRFGEVAEIVSGVTKGRKFHGRETETYPYLRVANVQRWFLDLRVMKEIEILKGEIEKYRLQQDDLLITEGGDWDKVGRTAIWDNQIKNCIHQNHVFRARLSNHEVLPFWAMIFLNSAIGRRYFEAASKQTTNLASINMRQLRACPLPLPPLAEQKRIVTKVNQLMSLCDELEAKLRQAEADSEKLMNAAVKHVLDSVRNASITAEQVCV